jgi:WD40 repeat protein
MNPEQNTEDSVQRLSEMVNTRRAEYTSEINSNKLTTILQQKRDLNEEEIKEEVQQSLNGQNVANETAQDTMYIPTLKLLRRKKCKEIHSLLVDEINNQIYLCSNDSRIQIFNTTNLDSRTSLIGPLDQLVQIDDRRIAGCDDDYGMIRIWDIVTFKEIQRLDASDDIFHLVLLSPDCLLGVSIDGTWITWIQNEHKSFEQHGSYVSSLACEKCLKISSRCIAVSNGSCIKICTLTEPTSTVQLKLAFTLRGHSGDVTALKLIGQEPQYLLSGGRDKSCKLWNLQQAALLKTYSDHPCSVYAILVLNSSMFISASKQLKVWRLYSGVNNATEIKEPTCFQYLQKSGNRQIVAGSASGNLLQCSYE